MNRVKTAIASVGRGIERVGDSLLWVSGASVVMMTLLVFVSVMGRWLFNTPVKGAVEISTYLYVLCIMLSLAYVLRVGRHIRIPLIFDRMPWRAKPWVELASNIILVVFLVVMFLGSCKLLIQSWQFRTISTTELGIALWIPQLFVPLGLLLISLQTIVMTTRSVRNFRKTPQGEN